MGNKSKLNDLVQGVGSFLKEALEEHKQQLRDEAIERVALDRNQSVEEVRAESEYFFSDAHKGVLREESAISKERREDREEERRHRSNS